MSILLFGASTHLSQTKLIPRILRSGFRKTFYVTTIPKPNSNWFTPNDLLPLTDVTYFSFNNNTLSDMLPKINPSTSLFIDTHIDPSSDFESFFQTIEYYCPVNTHFVNNLLFDYIPNLPLFFIDPINITEISLSISNPSLDKHLIPNLIMVISQMFSISCNIPRKSLLNSIYPFSSDNFYTNSTYTYCHTDIQLSESSHPLQLKFLINHISSNIYTINILTSDNYTHQFQIHPHSLYQLYYNDILINNQSLPSFDSYLNILESALNNNLSNFLSKSEILQSWNITKNLFDS